ncbi:MAG: tetratricopeptide repeat protein [Methylophilus sp.]|jgi:tetratricopeptide (TPR) repeat protein|nr:tetratricopeptide repeat protein [Methylophilus sp.]
MKRKLLTLVFALLITGCANPINQRTANNYFIEGESAMQQGNLPHAREMFSRALINARIGNLGAEAEGQVLAKLGRVYGNMCQPDEAEKAFSESITQYSKAYGENSTRLFTLKLELAQHAYDVGRYEKAVTYFDKAFPWGAEMFDQTDPAGYAAVMKDYADALSKTGKSEQAKAALAKASTSENKVGSAKVSKNAAEYVRYPTQCK